MLKRNVLLVFVLVLLLPGCTGLEDGMAAIRGEGGTIARSDGLAPAAEQARKIAAGRPSTAWETVVPHENADFIQFIDERRVLVGHIQVEAYLGVPSYSGLSLYDAGTGAKLWDAPRDHVGRGGEYSVIGVAPSVLVLGRSETALHLSALDPATGARRWNAALKAPLAHGLSADRTKFFVLSADAGRHVISAIDLSTGGQLWTRELADAAAKEHKPALLVDAQGLYVSGRTLLRLDGKDGRVAWSADAEELAAGSGAAAPLGGGILLWGPRSVALLDSATGRPRWRHRVAAGGVKLASALGAQVVLVATPDPASVVGGPSPVDTLSALDARSGRQLWTREVGGTVVSSVAAEQGVLAFSLEDAVVGLNAASGAVQFRRALPAAFRMAAPTSYQPAGQADLLHVREGRLYLSRESAGLVAYALPQGTELWRQGALTLDSRNYAFSTPGRTERLRTVLALGGQAQPMVAPAPSHFYQPVPSVQMQSLQRQYNALAIERQQAASRGDSGRAHWVGQHMQVNMQMQSFSRSMESAQQTLAAGVAAAGAIEAALKNMAFNGAMTRVTMEINQAARLHREAFQGRYWLRPYIDGWDSGALGVTVVDLDTGRRHDLAHSPLILAFSQNGVEAPQLALDPGGARLLTVGVGLKPELYQPYVLWKVRLPRPSLLAYDLAGLPYADTNPAVEQRLARAEAAPASREQDFVEAARIGNVVAVRRLLDAGVDVNTPTLHGFTALMMAADAGNESLARLLLLRGANVKVIAAGHSALDFASSAPVEKLLADSGAPARTQKGAPARGPTLDGGEIIDASYKPKVLVAFGSGSGEQIALVETPAGPAMLARNFDGSGVLYKTRWRDEQGDHYSMCINLPNGGGAAYEFIVPADRRKNSLFLTYQPGSYKVVPLDGGQRRPLPRPSAAYSMVTLAPK